MGRELEGYRDMLERIDTAFPGHEILRGQEISEFTGWSMTTVQRRLGPTKLGMAKCVLAKKLLTVTNR